MTTFPGLNTGAGHLSFSAAVIHSLITESRKLGAVAAADPRGRSTAKGGAVISAVPR